jgi:hypothetical protein
MPSQRRLYPAGVKKPDEEMDPINIRRDPFHGEWNYEILPRQWNCYFLTLAKCQGNPVGQA